MTEEELKKYCEENYEYFEVPGAGKIQISKEPDSSTGVSSFFLIFVGAVGFSFGVEWGSTRSAHICLTSYSSSLVTFVSFTEKSLYFFIIKYILKTKSILLSINKKM